MPCSSSSEESRRETANPIFPGVSVSIKCTKLILSNTTNKDVSIGIGGREYTILAGGQSENLPQNVAEKWLKTHQFLSAVERDEPVVEATKTVEGKTEEAGEVGVSATAEQAEEQDIETMKIPQLRKLAKEKGIALKVGDTKEVITQKLRDIH